MMAINWSILLNVLLLLGVIVAIVRTLKTHRRQMQRSVSPSIGQTESSHYDDIISVRKVSPNIATADPLIQATLQPLNKVNVAPVIASKPIINTTEELPAVQINPSHEVNKSFISHIETIDNTSVASLRPVVSREANCQQTLEVARDKNTSLMVFLLAKGQRQFAGYDLLQTVLAAGLRFGEGQLFHRHQHPNGQGPIMCSLAAATASGIFDMQQIGAFSVRGLCLFMHLSGNTTIDEERFEMMLDTARHLSESLDANLLDDLRKPFSEVSMMRYQQNLLSENLIEA